jgi:hypothetical protein
MARPELLTFCGQSGAGGGISSVPTPFSITGGPAVRATLHVSDSLFVGNTAIGGHGGDGGSGGHSGGSGGAGQGGGLINVNGSIGTVADAVFILNAAIGGNGGLGGNGGNGQGGGLFNDGPSSFGVPSLTLERSQVVNNEASGGPEGSGGKDGQGVGGGLYLTAGGIACADLLTIIAGNHASTSDDELFGVLCFIWREHARERENEKGAQFN